MKICGSASRARARTPAVAVRPRALAPSPTSGRSRRRGWALNRGRRASTTASTACHPLEFAGDVLPTELEKRVGSAHPELGRHQSRSARGSTLTRPCPRPGRRRAAVFAIVDLPHRSDRPGRSSPHARSVEVLEHRLLGLVVEADPRTRGADYRSPSTSPAALVACSSMRIRTSRSRGSQPRRRGPAPAPPWPAPTEGPRAAASSSIGIERIAYLRRRSACPPRVRSASMRMRHPEAMPTPIEPSTRPSAGRLPPQRAGMLWACIALARTEPPRPGLALRPGARTPSTAGRGDRAEQVAHVP